MTVKPFRSKEDQEWEQCREEVRASAADLLADDDVVGQYTLTIYRKDGGMEVVRDTSGFVDYYLLIGELVSEIVEQVSGDE